MAQSFAAVNEWMQKTNNIVRATFEQSGSMPPRFQCMMQCGSVFVSGEGGTKQAAKGDASIKFMRVVELSQQAAVGAAQQVYINNLQAPPHLLLTNSPPQQQQHYILLVAKVESAGCQLDSLKRVRARSLSSDSDL